MLSPRYPSSSSTCDSVEDNRFSTSAFCHEPFHPITLGSCGLNVGFPPNLAEGKAVGRTRLLALSLNNTASPFIWRLKSLSRPASIACWLECRLLLDKRRRLDSFSM